MADSATTDKECHDSDGLLQPRIPLLLSRLLTEAAAPKALQARVVAIAQQLRYGTGQVVAVITEPKRRVIMVSGVGSFEFPPNDQVFEEELIRAQDGGRMVMVTYRQQAQGQRTIDEVLVYAGTAAGSWPRY